MEPNQALPFSLSVLATLIVTSIWLLTPRVRILVHKEGPLRGFLLYEVCLTLQANGLGGRGTMQVSFYLSVKKS